MPKVLIVQIENHSDADPTHRPKNDVWHRVDPPTIYLEKLAVHWLQARRESLRADVTYRLNKLPDGYQLYSRPRPSNSMIVDKHLYGSPSQRFFDSPNRFAPHFLHLMRTGNNIGCPCTVCGSVAAHPLSIRTASHHKPTTAAPLKKPNVSNGPPVQDSTDDEHTPDALRILIDQLETRGTLDETYDEPLSMDWRAERAVLRTFDTLSSQPAYLPRIGELVLFIRSPDADTEICREDSSGEYKLFDAGSGTFRGHPSWQAGVVAQAADAVEPLNLEDVLEVPSRSQSITYSGFRVEPLPAPGHKDKSLSKQYKYVPLNLIRPFVFWTEFMHGIPLDQRHQTITNALAVMASWSLIEKFRFKGTWPNASVLCKAVYLGSELITIGDAVRIRASSNDPMSIKDALDVLHVTHIKLELTELRPIDDSVRPEPFKSMLVFYGKSYTLYQKRADPANLQPLSRQEAFDLPRGMSGYTWYRRHPASRYCRVTFNLVVGRVFEAEPMLLWFPMTSDASSQQPSLDYGYAGLLEARAYAKAHDKRIPAGKNFYWGESRGDCLDIHELNGIALSAHDPDRTEDREDEWLASAKLLSKAASQRDKQKLKQKANAPATKSGMAMKEPGSETEGDSGEQSQMDSEGATVAQSKLGELDLSRFAYSENKPILASDEPSEDVGADEDESDDVQARFGLQGPKPRKRSHSEAEAPDTREEDDETDELGGEDRMDVDSDGDVKGVFRSNGATPKGPRVQS